MAGRQVSLKHIKVVRQVRLSENHSYKQKPAEGGRYYRIEFDGLDCTGTRRIEYQRVACISLRQARQLVAELRVAAKGNWLDISEDVTLAQWLKAWLAVHCTDITPRTKDGYEVISRRHLTPALGHHKLSELTPTLINHFYVQQINLGFSPQTVLHQHRCLNKALRQAVATGYLARTPMTDAVRRPRVPRIERTFLHHSDVARLLKAVEGRSVEIPALLAALCGMRAGEVCGLRWGDIDLSTGFIRVQRAIEESQSGLRVKQPKSAKSVRNLPLPNEVKAALQSTKSRQAAQSMALVRSDAFVLGLDADTPLRPSVLSNRWRGFAGRHGFDGVRFHDLRHTYASLLLHEGAGIFVASRLMGHATAQLTTDLYGHLMSDHLELAGQISASIQKASA